MSFSLRKGDKILFVGDNEIAHTTLFEILSGRMEADSGSYKWGVTTTQAYMPKEVDAFFENKNITLIDWLREFSEDQSENFIRGFLGKMLFSGEETLKKANVLSGGEKARCMLSRMMLKEANVLLFDGPTNHLDLESITALNDALVKFPGTLMLVTHDQEFAQTVSNRIIEVSQKGCVDHQISYEEYLNG